MGAFSRAAVIVAHGNGTMLAVYRSTIATPSTIVKLEDEADMVAPVAIE